MRPDRRDLLRGGLAMAGLGAMCGAAHAAGAEPSQGFRLITGARDPLVSLFEREFMTDRRAPSGWRGGAFADLDDPGRFVWLRPTVDRLPETVRSGASGLGTELRLRLLTGSPPAAPGGAAPVWLATIHRLSGPGAGGLPERFGPVPPPEVTSGGAAATATLAGGRRLVQLSGFRTVAEMSAFETGLAIGEGRPETGRDALGEPARAPVRLRLRLLS